MRSRRSTCRLAAAAAIIGMVGLSACGTGEKAPETTSPSPTTTTTTTTTPPAAPTEKQVTPGGANHFTPTHVEPPAPPTGRHGIGSPHRQ
ncbi:hypothetical protein BN975_01742 [Mycolicibacterium farcinogenes]|nr:hypothetical protein [Mycolicibacterium senegalense]MCV7337523.1 hypothetical protein [Mycolicibacterium senegalense]QZA25918.1 hypothetical protein K3U95_07610 [Mycolicibacterium senegalense]CDP84712.1 hypothetical protein BN975_01742 [Mycolicibacterium farcinogenes]